MLWQGICWQIPFVSSPVYQEMLSFDTACVATSDCFREQLEFNETSDSLYFSFTSCASPTVYHITPDHGTTHDIIRINGSGFNCANEVSFSAGHDIKGAVRDFLYFFWNTTQTNPNTWQTSLKYTAKIILLPKKINSYFFLSITIRIQKNKIHICIKHTHAF